MSDEWPSAPRLEQALQDEAASAVIDPAARDHLAELLTDRDSAPGHRRVDPPSSNGLPRFLAVAAALLVVGVGVVLFDGQRRQPSETATSTSPPFSCELTTSLSEYLLDDGEITLGARANQPPDGGAFVSFVSLASASSWHDVAESQRLHEHLEGRSIITYGAQAAAEVADAVVGAQCTAHIYVLVEGMSSTALDEFICAPTTQTRGPSGLVLVEPPGPPTSCVVSQPVLLVGPDVLDGPLELWEEHLGCAAATAGSDGSVVRSVDCRHTLIGAETAADPWDSTIEGLPAPAWMLTIATVAN